jgi:fluoride exporter
MLQMLLVMAGGAIGAGLRYQVGRLALAQYGPQFPWGTLFVNLGGGLLMGLLAGTLARHQAGTNLGLFLGVGVLGGFTTFSAFSLDTFNMIERGALGVAASYVGASVIGSIAMLGVGLWLARAAS